MARVASSLEAPNRLALVLMGGGARAAYQAGALRALAEIAREVRVDANRCALQGARQKCREIATVRRAIIVS
jgi:predicted patatin/cPLA2 family phospholipase